MFQSDQLIYIQMQKTGCTHIAAVLSELFDGKLIGKHNTATAEQINSNRLFISSTRNPWDWYLSLWTYGTLKQGGVRMHLTTNMYQFSLKSTLRYPLAELRKMTTEWKKDTEMWRSLYANSEDVHLFRRWLHLIHDPKYKHLIDRGYGNTKAANFCGLMTYRHLLLCCKDNNQAADLNAIRKYEDIAAFDQKNNYIDFFIRMESLEDDLCQAIEKVRPLSQGEKEYIYSRDKKNASSSKRRFTLAEYYDPETTELIRRRERLLIEKFGYAPPSAL